jgi:hypothetical protein
MLEDVRKHAPMSPIFMSVRAARERTVVVVVSAISGCVSSAEASKAR